MPDINEDTLVEQGAIPPTDFHDKIERIREISDYDLEWQPDFLERLEKATDGLLFPEDTLRAVAAALRAGHVILQGPPGTGKSSLARALCDAFQASVFPVTAHEDWTVFDVIGRLELRLHSDRKEEIVPVNGYFTESAIKCANTIVKHFDDPSEPQAEWLLIDELNRANMDRAFGELFTVLGSDAATPITLPHQRDGNRNLVVPRRFRIVATLNSFDRQFVNNLSQAIRRRFTFITVNIPDRKPEGVLWSSSSEPAPLAVQEFRLVVRRAAIRTAKRTNIGEDSNEQQLADTYRERLLGSFGPLVVSLFDLVERVRYAGPEQRIPHLPIGTAQIIDTLELFMLRLLQDGASDEAAAGLLDWAVSVKLVPLFDTDVVAPEVLQEFATTLVAPFNKATRRELLGIVAAGTHFVE
ncbi:MoxR-like ATPase [Granulicella aggregans]|uniref:MoxR-like ATPase n=1 Tax=Granulicella aggregans TaxID=474949 RepID=A0A7W7ZJ63_9BACT|nr:AAA family ATPase [Granulicella aggregans]MBB5060762.1 MoxR-like ATPase [Granulicella aggregans]